MNAPEFTDEELMAYADGELDQNRAAALDLALAGDENLAARLGMFMDTRSVSADALRPMLDEPVPERLVQRVRDLAASAAAPSADGNVIAFKPKAAKAVAPFWQLPIAASIALAIGLGAGLLYQGGKVADQALDIAAITDPAISDALNTLTSGESVPLDDGGRIEAIATFRAEDNALCREFEHDRSGGTAVISIACHDGSDWQVRLAIAAVGADDTGYAPASSLEALDAYLTATNAGAPLASDEEAAALAELR